LNTFAACGISKSSREENESKFCSVRFYKLFLLFLDAKTIVEAFKSLQPFSTNSEALVVVCCHRHTILELSKRQKKLDDFFNDENFQKKKFSDKK